MAEKEDKELLTCLEAFKLLNVSHLLKTFVINIQQPFLKALKSGQLVHVFKIHKIDCTILLQQHKSKTYLLLYDSHLLYASDAYHVIILDPKGCLVKHDTKLYKTVWSIPTRFKKTLCTPDIFQHLTQTTISCETSFSNISDIELFLQHNNILHQVQLNYIISLFPIVKFKVLQKPKLIQNLKLNICVFNLNNKCYFTLFDNLWIKKLIPNQSCHKQSTLDKHTRMKNQYYESIPTNQDQLKTSTNRNCGINIMLKGTVLAYFCGLFSNVCEWKQICHEINKTVLFLWPHHDSNKDVRSIFVYCPSNEASFFSTLNVRSHLHLSNFDMIQYKSLWNFFKDQYDLLKKTRQRLLQHVYQLLQHSTQTKCHLFTKCLRELDHICNNQKIYFFQREDIFLHKFKMPFADFISQQFNAKIQIVADRHNVPFAIRSKYFDVDNIRNTITANEPFTFCLYDDISDLSQLFDTSQQAYFPYPVIPHTNWHDFKWENVYCPGSIMNTNITSIQHYVANRSLYLATMLATVFLNYSTWLADEFTLDSIDNRMSFSQQSYYCILQKTFNMGGMLFHSPEKIKPYYDCFLRSFCHGGFTFSAQTEIKKHDKLYPTIPTSPTALNIVEYDVVSSYGAAASNPNNFPGGFCMGYFNDNVHATKVVSSDYYKRFQSVEFTTVYAIIYYYSQLADTKIRAVFHNFGLLQLFKIGPYIIDLVIVLECTITNTVKEIAMFQVDGQYVHGCDICPPLKSYIGKKSLQDVRQATQQRDEYIQAAIALLQLPFTYNVVSNCHDLKFGKTVIKSLFKKDQPLHHLVSGYDYLLKHEIDLQDLQHVPPEMTFIIICQGTLDQSKMSFLADIAQNYLGGILPCMDNEDKKNAHSFESITCQNTLLTQQWYTFLTQELNFKVTFVKAIFFFKVCKTMPQVYHHLIEQRQNAKSQCLHLKAELYKRLINVSCGYFGLNLNKDHSTNKIFITNSLPKKYKLLKHKFELLGSIGSTDYLLQSRAPLFKKYWRKNKTHVASFIHIIEEGKLQLYKKLLMILTMCKPFTVKLMYSNIDNLILAIASDDTNFESIIQPQYFQDYKTLALPILSGLNPGQLKLEWDLSKYSDWSFITPRPCIYVVDKDNISKFSSINKTTLDHQTLYSLAQNILNKTKTTVSQVRRDNKLYNLNASIVNIQYN